MEKPAGVKDVGNYRFFIFTSSPKTVRVSPSSLCVTGRNDDDGCSFKGKSKRYGNIMWDPRVCRGVYVASSNEKSCDKLCNSLPQKKKKVFLRTELPPRKISSVITKASFKSQSLKSSSPSRSTKASQLLKRTVTPPPVDGRLHAILQTDEFAEYLEDDEHPMDDIGIQTDDYVDMPVVPGTPIHLNPVCSPTVVESSTQCCVWDICDLDETVRPVSENLTTAIIARALQETMDELELQSLVQQRHRFMQQLHDEAVRIESLRLQIVKGAEQRCIEEERKRFRKEHEAHLLLTANTFASNYLDSFVDTIREKVDADKESRDKIRHHFGGWLNRQVEREVGVFDVSREITDDIIHRVSACTEKFKGICLPFPRVPTNSAISFRYPSKSLLYRGYAYPEEGGEGDGEYQHDGFFDGNAKASGVNTLWKVDPNEYDSGVEKSKMFFDEYSTETETENTGSQDEV